VHSVERGTNLSIETGCNAKQPAGDQERNGHEHPRTWNSLNIAEDRYRIVELTKACEQRSSNDSTDRRPKSLRSMSALQ